MDGLCNRCNVILSFPTSFNIGLCARCRGSKMAICRTPKCGKMFEVIGQYDYCPAHFFTSDPDPEKNSLRSRCVLCKIKDIPVDTKANALDDSRLTTEGYMHDACYTTARKVLLGYVAPSVADRIRRLDQPAINIRVRKMRIDP